MTGPEHYAEAQRLIEWAGGPGSDGHAPEARAEAIGTAQVHATLAQVYAHNRATTELTGLLNAMLDRIQEVKP